MTVRLYYSDSYLKEFEASVLERRRLPEGPALILDRTIFYPTGGGQPHDTGYINGARVLDVREADGAILHLLDKDIDSDRVRGRIDWDRRFDHMQQHSGQHILSQAFIKTFGAETLSFHLGRESATIDLKLEEPSWEKIEAAEELANKIVFENRPLHVRFFSREEAAALPLRREGEVEGELRIIDIEGFDMTPCGGTHVARSGEIGLILTSRFEKYKGLCRVEFCCGGRALRFARSLNRTVSLLERSASAGRDELPRLISKLIEENKEKSKQIKTLMGTALEAEARALVSGAPSCGGVKIVLVLFEGRDINELKILASKIAAQGSAIALLGLAGSPAQAVLARSSNLELDVAKLVRDCCSRHGGRGGGRQDYAQAGGIPLENLRLFLEEAESRVKNSL